MKQKVLLMILDGWGIGNRSKGDVISTVHPAYISAMTEKYPHAQLHTDGENVGLPDGQMGNSEVGHLNIGAGRVVYQDLVKINRACKDGSIMENAEVKAAFEYAKAKGVNVHFMGLVSDGGVHSSIDHLYKLCDIAKTYGIEHTYVHCFMDGRDTDPHSGKGFIEALERHTAQSTGVVASIIGRYYAMDRDKRWERVKVAYDQLVNGVGEPATDMVAAMQKSYDADVTDEFVKPIVRVDAEGKAVGTIRPGDMVIFFNYRNDRAKELTVVLTQEDMPAEGMHTLPLYYCCMTPYDAKFQGLHILFDKENVQNTIGEYVSSLGLSQLRIAETEKYAHVTFFLNGKEVERMIDVRASLTDMLRNDFSMTSVKKGCEVGECGACNVLIDGECYNSCLYLAVWAEGKHITTLEGLMGPNGELSDIQQAFMEETSIQCGFCIPGFIMTAVEILDRGVYYTDDQLRKLLSGHLCRCTGYENIFKAVKKTMLRRLGRLDDPFLNT